MRRNGASLEVVVGRRPVREYVHSDRCTYVEGRQGSEYELRLRNESGRRAVFVVTVDGLSIMDGKPGTVNGSGYIVEPGQAQDIPGWRLNLNATAHFQFSTLPEAYASQMGRPENIGVIGVAVFNELRKASPCEGRFFLGGSEVTRGGGPLTFGSSGSKGVGTGFGRETEHQVRSEHFDREVFPTTQFNLNYKTREELLAMGVRLDASSRIDQPSAFPADNPCGCIPPPDWRG